MNTTIFLQTMIEILKYDSKFKEKKGLLLPILQRVKVNSLPQWEYAKSSVWVAVAWFINQAAVTNSLPLGDGS